MLKKDYKNILINLIIVFIIFFLDRLTKFYIIELSELENSVDIFVTPYLNLYLVWNQGVAFGLFSFDSDIIYNFISFLIAIIMFIILIMFLREKSYKKYFLIFIFSGAMGNFFDRIYYGAVPDFIDFHINNIHWFIFNVADIFISIGVICILFIEILTKKKSNETN